MQDACKSTGILEQERARANNSWLTLQARVRSSCKNSLVRGTRNEREGSKSSCACQQHPCYGTLDSIQINQQYSQSSKNSGASNLHPHIRLRPGHSALIGAYNRG